ncbi:MAG: winged helix-turn-helix domain-containing protein [Nanoarchaeota archaeon]|nr:winged helix-turn-helix domain-containing protein [Nanoarchaeota archaeon]
MSKGKRDRIEVIYDILKIIKEHNNSIKPTPLLRFSNLSFNSFQEYEQELIKKDFIKIILDKKDKKHYTLTDKGFEYIQKYKIIRGFIEEFDLF